MEKKFKIKAFLLMLICFFNCGVLCFSFTVAWFTSIRNASTQTETGFKIDSPKYVESVKYHQFKDRADSYIDFYFEESESLDDGRNSKDMGFYNLLDENYQTLMEVTLTSDAIATNEIDLYAVTEATMSHLTANETGAPDYPLTNKEGEYNSLSSIIDFYVFYSKDLEVDDTKIRLTKIHNENSDKRYNFIENDHIIEGNSVRLAKLFPSTLVVDGVAKFYIMLDYNEENCAKMYGNNLGNEAIEEGHFHQEGTDLPILGFKADFEFTLKAA